MAEKEFVVFTIDEIVDRKTDFVKLKAQGYTLNYKYNAQYSPANFSSKFQVGDHLSAPVAKVPNSHGGTSRYINDPIKRVPADVPNTWTAPEGGGWSGKSGGRKSDFDPATSLRQTAANCAMNYFAHRELDIEVVVREFPEMAEMVHAWLVKSEPSTFQGDGGDGYGEVPGEAFAVEEQEDFPF